MIAKSTCFVALFLLGLHVASAAQALAQPFDEPLIAAAFDAACEGYSSDELLVQKRLRDGFLDHLSPDQPLDADAQRDALLKLLRMRKAGKLKSPTTRRGKPVSSTVLPVSEIASRVVTDRHRITSDTMLADPRYRAEFLREAEKIRPGIDPYEVSKGVLSLRKKRALRPELVLQVARWDRQIKTYSLDELRLKLAEKKISANPGVYLFRGASRYLYIGEAQNLQQRLSEHSSGSDRKSLADYLAGREAKSVTVELHVFPADSPAGESAVRRAYESELIRSRNPQFNVRP